ncbi:MAG: FKBP-type peptidyl-prolyl cis-trans isomerase [Candidatus Hodarchaeales archaeon]|jgi:hypothetical protein
MKRSLIGLLALIGSLSLLSGQIITPANTSVVGGFSEGDIVAVHYVLTLYGYSGSGLEEFIQEGDLEGEQGQVEVKSSQTKYLQKFVDAIFGMYQGETKKFIILKQYGYTNPSHDLYDKDLYYEITVTNVYYDALPLISGEGTTTTTTTTTTNPTTTDVPIYPLDPMLILGFVGIGGLAFGGVAVFYVRSRSSSYEQIQSTTEIVMSKEKSQLTEISKLVEERRRTSNKSGKTETKRTRSARRRR